MLTEYLRQAMRQASYKQLDDATWFGEIEGFEGVWANAESVETCREELQEVLEEWLVFKLKDGDAVPVVAGINLNTPLTLAEAQ
jgi:predicted RNase H-like HicB family nuclease